MATRRALNWFAMGLALAMIGSSAYASTDVVEKVQAHLYAGQTAVGIVTLSNGGRINLAGKFGSRPGCHSLP